MTRNSAESAGAASPDGAQSPGSPGGADHPGAPVAPRPHWLQLAVIGLVAGAFGGLFGLGGGIIIVSALVLICGYDQRRAAVTSALSILPTVVIGVISYAFNGSVDWVAGLALTCGIIVGSQLGSRLLGRISIPALEALFLAFLLLSIALLWAVVPERGATFSMNPLLFAGLAVFGLLPGLAVSLLGIGGGVITIPVLIAGFGVSDLIAKGTSLVMAVAGSASSSLRQLRTGLLDARTALIMGVVAAATTPFSVQLAVLLDPLAANILFSLFLAVVAAQYIRRLVRYRRGIKKA